MKQLEPTPAGSRMRSDFSADPLPLVVFPAGGPAAESGERASALRACAERYLPRLGSILFRGFQVYEPAEFERFVELFGARVAPVHAGSIWGEVGGGRLWVSCLNAPESSVDTLIADNRDVYANLSLATRTRLVQRGLRYVLTMPSRTWREVFRTAERAEIESFCHAHDTSFSWQADGSLRLERAGASVSRHPRTGEPRWADAGPLLHHACSAREATIGDPGDFRALYADGSPLEREVAAEIVDAFDEAASRVDWEAGDVLVVDRTVATTCIPANQRGDLQSAIATLSCLS